MKNVTVLNVHTAYKVALSSRCPFISFLTYFSFSLHSSSYSSPHHASIIMCFIFPFLGWFNQPPISSFIQNSYIYVGCSLFIDKLAAIFNIWANINQIWLFVSVLSHSKWFFLDSFICTEISFLNILVISYYAIVSHFHYPFICWRMSRLFSILAYYEKGPNEPDSSSSSVVGWRIIWVYAPKCNK